MFKFFRKIEPDDGLTPEEREEVKKINRIMTDDDFANANLNFYPVTKAGREKWIVRYGFLPVKQGLTGTKSCLEHEAEFIYNALKQN